MKNKIPFPVPILLDEIYVFDHKSASMSTVKAYADVTNHKTYYVISKCLPDGRIIYVKSQISPKVIREKERTVKRRKVIERLNITDNWMQQLQSEVSPRSPIKTMEWKVGRRKVKTIISLNPNDHSEIFIKVGDSISVIVKEKVQSNWIQAVMIAAAWELLDDTINDFIDDIGSDIWAELGVSVFVEISVDGSGFSIKVVIEKDDDDEIGGPSM